MSQDSDSVIATGPELSGAVTYTKGASVQLSEHFWSHEFDCRCNYSECTTTLIHPDLIQALAALRQIVGPIDIDCGYRCPRHNADIGGVADSQHIIGKAADVMIPNLNGDQIRQKAELVPQFMNGGIGSAGYWAHLDVRGTIQRWTYPLQHPGGLSRSE